MEEIYKKAAEAIKNANAIVITAGAGIGVDSGLPDFRGNSGFWREYPAIADKGYSFAEMANPQWFSKKPSLAWAFYGHRLELYRKTEPHEGFYKLLKLGKSMKYGYFVYTSNVDGQFQKAGFDDDFIDEAHGSIHHFQCSTPCSGDIWNAEHEEVYVDMGTFSASEPFPVCPHCGAVARPNILMFGDGDWIYNRSAEQSQNLSAWLKEIESNNANLVIIEMGAGKAIPTVRMKSTRLAKRFNGTLIRINPRDYEIRTSVNGISIPTGAKEGINNILDKI